MPAALPYIDPNVQHVGVSKLRELNAATLRTFNKTLVIQDSDKPLAVLLTYDQFLQMQNQLEAVRETIAVLTDEEERSLLVDGIKSVAAGKTKPLSEIRAAIKAR